MCDLVSYKILYYIMYFGKIINNILLIKTKKAPGQNCKSKGAFKIN